MKTLGMIVIAQAALLAQPDIAVVEKIAGKVGFTRRTASVWPK